MGLGSFFKKATSSGEGFHEDGLSRNQYPVTVGKIDKMRSINYMEEFFIHEHKDGYK